MSVSVNNLAMENPINAEVLDKYFCNLKISPVFKTANLVIVAGLLKEETLGLSCCGSIQKYTLIMKRTFAIFFAIAALVAIVSAVDVPIKVGDGGLKFNPATVDAKPGDNVVLTWVGGSHTVIQSDSDSCTASATTSNNKQPAQTTGTHTIAIPANATTGKWWFYCGVGNHCASGMKFVINVAGAAAGNGTGSGSGNGTTGGSGGTTGSTGSASSVVASFGVLFTALVATLLL
jgi:plastocyanin